MGDSQLDLRAIGVRVYLPALFFGIGQGAVAPILVLTARDAGASTATAGLVVALMGVGSLAGDLPAGALAGRVGERRAMAGAGLLMAIALLVIAVAPSVVAIAVGTLLMGLSAAVWQLSRQAYVAEAVPYAQRARALSTLGGVHRIGMFTGPFLGAGAIRLFGLDGPYWLHIALIALGIVAVLALPDPEEHAVRDPGSKGVLGTMRESFPVLRTVGIGVVLVGAVRSSRQVVIPLWAAHLGLDATAASLIFGVAGAVDMLLFYPAGLVMDKRGRAWIAVPSMALLGLSMLLLPLTGGVVALTLVALLMGAGNGMGSGLIMTLGADYAPPGRRAEFLGGWRLFGDTGTAGGPLALSGLTALLWLGPAIAIMGGVGLAAAALLGYWIPRTPHRAARVSSGPADGEHVR